MGRTEARNEPEYHGKLNDQQREKVREWLEDKWGYDAKCPLCKHGEWVTSTSLVGTPAVDGTGFKGFSTSVGYVFVPVSCANCGYTVLLDTDDMELWPLGI